MAALTALTYLVTTATAVNHVFPLGSAQNISPHILGIENEFGELPQGPQLESLYGSDDMEAPMHTFNHQKRAGNYGSGTPYWMSQIKRQGKAPFQSNSSYVIWRNVRDYGAKGDGVTDDLYAISNATADGNRCGAGCDSSTTTPAIVYFPPGTYMLSDAVPLYYYTDMIGDPNDLPIIKGMSTFDAIGLFVSCSGNTDLCGPEEETC